MFSEAAVKKKIMICFQYFCKQGPSSEQDSKWHWGLLVGGEIGGNCFFTPPTPTPRKVFWIFGLFPSQNGMSGSNLMKSIGCVQHSAKENIPWNAMGCSPIPRPHAPLNLQCRLPRADLGMAQGTYAVGPERGTPLVLVLIFALVPLFKQRLPNLILSLWIYNCSSLSI